MSLGLRGAGASVACLVQGLTGKDNFVESGAVRHCHLLLSEVTLSPENKFLGSHLTGIMVPREDLFPAACLCEAGAPQARRQEAMMMMRDGEGLVPRVRGESGPSTGRGSGPALCPCQWAGRGCLEGREGSGLLEEAWWPLRGGEGRKMVGKG